MNELDNFPHIRFPEFEGKWDIETIGGISRIYGRIGYRGYTVQDIVDKGEGAIALSPSNFVNNRIDATNSTYISWFKYEESPEIKILDGDILFVKTGSTYGKTAFVSNIKEKATINPQIVVLKNISISNRFLGYVVTTQNIKKQVEQIVVGGAIPTMSQTEISKMKFGLPTKPEQQKIAAFLTEVDNKIEQLSKKQEVLSEYKKGLMQKIFSQEIRFKVDDGSDFPDWEEKKLKDSFDVVKPKKVKDGLSPYLEIGDINSSNHTYTLKDKATVSGAIAIEKDTLLISTVRPGLNKIVITKSNVYASSAFATIKLKNSFLFHLLTTKKFNNLLVRLSEGGTYPTINKLYIYSLSAYLPVEEEQTKIANFLSSIDNKIEQVGEQLDKSKEFKKALLQQMFV